MRGSWCHLYLRVTVTSRHLYVFVCWCGSESESFSWYGESRQKVLFYSKSGVLFSTVSELTEKPVLLVRQTQVQKFPKSPEVSADLDDVVIPSTSVMADLFDGPSQHTTGGFHGAPVTKFITGASIVGHVALNVPMFASLKNVLHCNLTRKIESESFCKKTHLIWPFLGSRCFWKRSNLATGHIKAGVFRHKRHDILPYSPVSIQVRYSNVIPHQPFN